MSRYIAADKEYHAHICLFFGLTLQCQNSCHWANVVQVVIDMACFLGHSALCGCRGVSSTVRRCTEKSTGRQYAVKIFEMSDSDHCDDDPTSLALKEELEELRKSTMKEVDILKHCAGQPHISKSTHFCL